KLRLRFVSTSQSFLRPIQLDKRFHGAEIWKHAATLRLDPVWTSFRSHRSLHLYRFGKGVERFCLATKTALRLSGFGQRVSLDRKHGGFLRRARRSLRKLQRLRVVPLLAIRDCEPAHRVGHVSLSSQRRVERQSLMKTLQRERLIFLGQVNGADAEQDVRAIELVRSFLI